MGEPRASLGQSNVVRRVIYLLVAAAVVVPCIVTVSLPGKPNHLAEKVYQRVDDLKAGSHVLLAFDYDPSSKAELEPMSRAVLRHCFRKGVVPIVMTHWPSGLNLAKDICESTAAENWETFRTCMKDANFPCTRAQLIAYAENQKSPPPVLQSVLYVLDQLGERTYQNLEDVRTEKIFDLLPKTDLQAGRDYVVLGFRPGGAMLVLQMGENLKGAFEKDVDGRLTQSMPALQGVNSLRDIDLAIDFAAGSTVEMWVAYGSDRFNFPLAAGTTAVSAPEMYTWMQSGQIIGFLGGLRGAADYEVLLDMPGEAIKGMPSQSAAHVLLALLILGANIGVVARRFARKREGRPYA